MTIYRHPLDYPGMYVARAFTIVAGSDPIPEPMPIGVGPTLEAVRAMLPDGMYNLGRDPGDEPQIVETWI